MPSKDTLVLGFGSDILSDEGIAIRLVNDLKRKWEKHADFLTHLTFSLDVLNDIAAYKRLVLIDANLSKKIGEVQCYSIDEYPDTLHLVNYHDISLKGGIEYAQKIGFEVPEYIGIITISISQLGFIHDDFSKELSRKYKSILSEIEQLIEDFIFQVA